MELTVKGISDLRSIITLSAGHVCIDFYQGAVPALLPFLIVEQHLSYASAAGLVLATNLASSIIQPLFGQFADSVSAPWLMPAGLLTAGIGLTLVGFAPGYWLTALAVAISGIGVAAFHPEAARLVNAVAARRRATGMSIFSIGGTAGFALGPLLTTAVLVVIGLRGTPLLIIPAAVLALVLVASFPRFSPYRSGLVRKQQAAQAERQDAWGPFACLTVMVMCRSIAFFGLNTFLPLYWVTGLHQSRTAGGVALTVLLASGAIGTLVGGRLADRYGRRIVVLIALASLAPLLLLFVVLSPLSVPLAFVLLFPIGIALFAPSSVMVVMGQEYLPNRVGTASGVTLGLAITVGGIAAPIFGHVADLYGVHAALVGLVFVPLVATVLTLTLPRSVPTQDAHKQESVV